MKAEQQLDPVRRIDRSSPTVSTPLASSLRHQQPRSRQSGLHPPVLVREDRITQRTQQHPGQRLVEQLAWHRAWRAFGGGVVSAVQTTSPTPFVMFTMRPSTPVSKGSARSRGAKARVKANMPTRLISIWERKLSTLFAASGLRTLLRRRCSPDREHLALQHLARLSRGSF
jgi:hypothetical protein